jgi:hypothetical protein
MIEDALTLQRDKAKSQDRYSHPARRVGAHSRRHNLVKVDGRTKEGALLATVRAELIEHVGGSPTAVQRAMIERCAWLSLRLSLLDEKIASGNNFTEVDSN